MDEDAGAGHRPGKGRAGDVDVEPVLVVAGSLADEVGHVRELQGGRRRRGVSRGRACVICVASFVGVGQGLTRWCYGKSWRRASETLGEGHATRGLLSRLLGDQGG